MLNVGAGTGSYEPAGREVTAVEPSATMMSQRPSGAAPVVQASAEELPFDDDSFDAAMAMITVHHWARPRGGGGGDGRVARERVVILTFDPGRSPTSGCSSISPRPSTSMPRSCRRSTSWRRSSATPS